jgi:hypothetical protein
MDFKNVGPAADYVPKDLGRDSRTTALHLVEEAAR